METMHFFGEWLLTHNDHLVRAVHASCNMKAQKGKYPPRTETTGKLPKTGTNYQKRENDPEQRKKKKEMLT